MNYYRNITFRQGLAQTGLSIIDSSCHVAPTLKEMELISYLHIIQYLTGESKKMHCGYKFLYNYCWLHRVVPNSFAESRTALRTKL